MQSHKRSNRVKKLSKKEIINYYHCLAFPQHYGLEVPIDQQVRAFEKLLQWQGVKVPEVSKEDRRLDKMVLQIKCAKPEEKEEPKDINKDVIDV